jgi:hypothetical protein
MKRMITSPDQLPPFDRDFFGSGEVLTRIGSGAIGGKAAGLVFAKRIIDSRFENHDFRGIEITVPRMAVVTADVFESFMDRNGLRSLEFDDLPDDRIAHAFQEADFPAEMIGDLRGLISAVRTPLAVRSSSVLEDALYEPFAGVYETKMIPNNQPDIDTRFRKLIEAVKFVYASTFFRSARGYLAATGQSPEDESMPVVIQEVVGKRFSDRFYPHISGVARSYNFYPVGRVRPEDGVVNLALGLGKTIVDGGTSWTYSPKHPRIPPPAGGPGDLLKLSQTRFWAVGMGNPPEYDPIRETEYLVTGSLADAEADGVLDLIASTYRPQDDRLEEGVSFPGPRVLTFAPILQLSVIPLNDLIGLLLEMFEEAVENEIEVEFAATLGSRGGPTARFGFLQVRPMVVSRDRVDVSEREMEAEDVILASDRALGNGSLENLYDIVCVRPDTFDAKHTRRIADELDVVNRRLVSEKRPYLLIGFGRWGSSDPWLGIPVVWAQVGGARVIVEATRPGMEAEFSQGTHFFHNMSSFGVYYFSVGHHGKYRIDWEWLESRDDVSSTPFIRHIRLPAPLEVKVDGKSGRGVVRHG